MGGVGCWGQRQERRGDHAGSTVSQQGTEQSFSRSRQGQNHSESGSDGHWDAPAERLGERGKSVIH